MVAKGFLTAILLLIPSVATPQQADDCSVEINGALKGGPGNIQDHMFHSLAIDPVNENIVYAGTETSGIFKTVDGGVTWSRLRLGFKCTPNKTGYSQIFDIAIDPANTQILYAATVNGPGPVGNAAFPSSSGGVYKSTDGGLTWTQKVNGFTNSYVTFVKVDATNHNRVYAGLGGVKSTFGNSGAFYEGGIWVSNDAAESWSALPTPPGISTNIFVDMELAGANQRTIYASAQLHGTDAPAAYGFIRSTDGGQTWSISNPAARLVYGFGSFKQDPNILYAHDDSDSRRVHQSTDGGVTWVPLNAGLFGPIRVHPRDSRTVLFLGRTGILKTSDGFASQREVYNDPDLPLNAQMVDIRISDSNPSVVWACAKGYFMYKSTDGGETFAKITGIRDLVYGNPLSMDLPSVFNSGSAMTGIALVNSSSSPIETSLTAFNNAGAIMKSSPVSIPAGTQIARLASEWFGPTIEPDFRVRISASKPGISGFYLHFDPALNTLDGGNLSNRLSRDFIVPEARGATISIANPDPTRPADVVFRLFDPAGKEPMAPGSARIPPSGRVVLSSADRDGYLRITSADPVFPIAQSGTARDKTTMPALYADGGARNIYAPQYVAGGGYQSTVTLINLETTDTTVNITWFDNSAIRLGQSISRPIAALGSLTFSGAGVFGITPPAAGVDGYLVIGSSNLMTGFVRYGDAAGARFETSLPLIGQTVREALFAHVAQDATYFTGVAIVNRNTEPAAVTVTVFNTAGAKVGAGQAIVPPNGRVSQLLAEIVPQLPPSSGGYFKLTSDRNILSFAVFGTRTLSVLAALPMQ